MPENVLRLILGEKDGKCGGTKRLVQYNYRKVIRSSIESLVGYVNKKEKKSTFCIQNKAHVRTNDKNVTVLHHAGDHQPTFTFVPVMKSFPY